MKERYHVFKRGNGVFYCLDTDENRQSSLRTRDLEEAQRLVNAKNEACRQPAMNLEIARVYLNHSDPAYASRKWQSVMDEAARQKAGDTRNRWTGAMRQAPFDLIRGKILVETKAQDFLGVLATGTVCTNIFLRRLHNFALEMDWIPKSVIPRRQWPKISFRERRGVVQN